eukprot:7766491-Pyramimonas_sp.AAC.2
MTTENPFKKASTHEFHGHKKKCVAGCLGPSFATSAGLNDPACPTAVTSAVCGHPCHSHI